MKYLILAFLIFFTSCSNESKNIPQIPTSDYSTPDNTVKSIWKYVVWNDTSKTDTTMFGFYSLDRLQKEREMNKVNYEKLKTDHPFNKNTIVDVQIKSDSYALVEAKVFSEYSKEPSDIRYILSKQESKWKIDDIQSVCYSCEGSGVMKDLDQQLKDIQNGYYRSNPKKKCDVCNATGWRSHFRN